MRILVTGGAGYVGSHCVRRFVEAGHDVVVYDNLASGHREAVHARARLVTHDLSDAAALTAALREFRIEAVLHCAASIDVGESVREPLKYYRNNACNSVNLLEAMRSAGVQRLVFSSTCATYGNPVELPLTEDHPQQPINPYGRAKLAIEWAMRDSADAWGLGAVAFRYFNAAGAAADGSIGEDHRPETHLVPIVLQVALGQRDKVQVFGTDYATPDGSCVRDYIHVEDLAEAHLRAITTISGPGFRAFNLGTGVGHSVLDVIHAAREVTGHPIPLEIAPRRPGDAAELYANAGLVRHALGWIPRYTSISDVVASAWRWHRTHPNGYQRDQAAPKP